MRLLRHLQHWLGGAGPRLEVTDFVPDSHPIRLWADTFPWADMVAAIEQSVVRRFPKTSARGRPGVSVRVLLALELLKHELTCSDEAICDRLRTDFAVMYEVGPPTQPVASARCRPTGNKLILSIPKPCPTFARVSMRS